MRIIIPDRSQCLYQPLTSLPDQPAPSTTTPHPCCRAWKRTGGRFDPVEEEEEEPREPTNEVDPYGTGCVLCKKHDFLRGGFGERTILICDQCEREFHVGCLKEHHGCDLQVRGEGCAAAAAAGGGGVWRAGL
jgi:hypothetical protein